VDNCGLSYGAWSACFPVNATLESESTLYQLSSTPHLTPPKQEVGLTWPVITFSHNSSTTSDEAILFQGQHRHANQLTDSCVMDWPSTPLSVTWCRSASGMLHKETRTSYMRFVLSKGGWIHIANAGLKKLRGQEMWPCDRIVWQEFKLAQFC
jgi:hypothetical protein